MVIGILLTILGVLCYVFWKQLGAPKQSVTALIPAMVGLPMMVLGWLSLAQPDWRKNLMHIAVVLSLLGFLMAFGRFAAVTLNPNRRNFGPGIQATLVMAILCAVHVVMSVRSFIAARKAREETSSPPPA